MARGDQVPFHSRDWVNLTIEMQELAKLPEYQGKGIEDLRILAKQGIDEIKASFREA